MDEDGPTLSVAEFVEYCRTQARLLGGKVETLTEDLDGLLADLDAEMAALRDQLDDASADGPTATPGGTDPDVDIDELEETGSSLEAKQSLAAAKGARLDVLQELAAGYVDLAAELQSEVTDGETALSRVVEFEADHDAPAAFPDRQTVLEAAAESADAEDADDSTAS